MTKKKSKLPELDQKIVKTAQKQVKKTNEKIDQKKYMKKMAEIFILFEGMGAEAGVEICEAAKELHPDAFFIFPLYRSCIVIPKQEYSGGLKVIAYHDPCWMGADVRTPKNLPNFKEVFEIVGQRSGVEIYEGFFNYSHILTELQWKLEPKKRYSSNQILKILSEIKRQSVKDWLGENKNAE